MMRGLSIILAIVPLVASQECTEETNALLACTGSGADTTACSTCRAESAQASFKENGFANDCATVASNNCRLLDDCSSICSCLKEQIAQGICQSNVANGRNCTFSSDTSCEDGAAAASLTPSTEAEAEDTVDIDSSFTEGPQSDDKLVINQAHDNCVNFDGRSPQLYGNETIENCELTSSPDYYRAEFKCDHKRPPRKWKDLSDRYEAMCEKEGGKMGEAPPQISAFCTGSGLIDYYNDTLLSGLEKLPHYAKGTFYFTLYECYANDACLDTYDFNYKYSKEKCEAYVGYQRWFAGYLEDMYEAAGSGPVECTYDHAYFHTGCYKMMEESGATSDLVNVFTVMISLTFTMLLADTF